jgi:hypothetical protein
MSVRWECPNGTERELDVRAELTVALREMGWLGRRVIGTETGSNSLADLTITIRRGHKPHATGHAWGNYEVAFTFGECYENNLELIYHEAAHLASLSGEGHGRGFRRTLADGLQARWPFLVYGRVNAGAVYDADRRIVQQMKDHVRNGGEL